MAKSSRSKKYINRAESYAKLDLLYKRVTKILTSLGLPLDPHVWVYFDLALYHIPVADRRKILKQIFSKWGSDIKLEHEEHIELLETFSKKVIEGF